MWVWLRLKLIADIGFVGVPNAGKSTFVYTSNAKPKKRRLPFYDCKTSTRNSQIKFGQSSF